MLEVYTVSVLMVLKQLYSSPNPWVNYYLFSIISPIRESNLVISGEASTTSQITISNRFNKTSFPAVNMNSFSSSGITRSVILEAFSVQVSHLEGLGLGLGVEVPLLSWISWIALSKKEVKMSFTSSLIAYVQRAFSWFNLLMYFRVSLQ